MNTVDDSVYLVDVEVGPVLIDEFALSSSEVFLRCAGGPHGSVPPRDAELHLRS